MHLTSSWYEPDNRMYYPEVAAHPDNRFPYESDAAHRQIAHKLASRAHLMGSIKGCHAKEEDRAKEYRPGVHTRPKRKMAYTDDNPANILVVKDAVRRLRHLCSPIDKGFALNLDQAIPVIWEWDKREETLGLTVCLPGRPYDREKYKMYANRLIKHIFDYAGVQTPSIKYISA
jgi:hypothetical protein